MCLLLAVRGSCCILPASAPLFFGSVSQNIILCFVGVFSDSSIPADVFFVGGPPELVPQTIQTILSHGLAVRFAAHGQYPEQAVQKHRRPKTQFIRLAYHFNSFRVGCVHTSCRALPLRLTVCLYLNNCPQSFLHTFVSHNARRRLEESLG